MSAIHDEARLLYHRGLLESASARFKMMLAVNAVRLHSGQPIAYSEEQIVDAADTISHHVIDPRDFE